MQEIFVDVFSVQGGVGKVAGLRRGSHETALAQNQEVEGSSKPGEKVRWFRWSLGELRLWSRVVQVELTSLFQVVGLKTRWVRAETCLCLEDWERGGRE